MKPKIHGRAGGYLNMDAASKGETWQSAMTFCGMLARYPNLFTVVELGDKRITCKKCLAKAKAIRGK